MTIELVEVKLHPIPKYYLNTEDGKKIFEKVIDMGDDHPYFPVQVDRRTVDSGFIPFYFFVPLPIDSDQKGRQKERVYKTVRQYEEIVDGESIFTIYGTIESATNLS